MRVEKQSTVWQANSMGKFDKIKLKMNNIMIDCLLSYLSHNFSKEKLINLAKIFEKIAGSKCNGFSNQNTRTFIGGKRF